MYVLWLKEPDTRMDFVGLGTCLVGRHSPINKPNMVLVTLDEIEHFSKQYGIRGPDKYREYMEKYVEPALENGGDIVIMNEYNHLATMSVNGAVSMGDWDEREETI